MNHPFRGIGFIYYLLAWAIVIIAHALVLSLGYGQSVAVAAFDAVVCNGLLAAVGYSLWWAIQYFKPSTQGTFATISTFVVIIIMGASAVHFICDAVLHYYFSANADYISLTQNIGPWRMVTGTLYLSVVILIYYLLKNAYNLGEKEKQEVQLQSLLKHSELEMLKFQINPHFIFNSLNSISSLTISDPERAREMVIKLSSFLRGSLGQDKDELHTLESELEQMNLYLEIEKVRFGDRLTVNLTAADSLMNLKVPNMILQPLYENAVKYGVYEQLEQVTINTTCCKEQQRLVIKVENNYDSDAATQKGKGIGLKNVRGRLELIYGVPDLVTIERGKDKYCIRLEIPQNLQA